MKISQFRPYETYYPFLNRNFLMMKDRQCGKEIHLEYINHDNGYQVTCFSLDLFRENFGFITHWTTVMAKLAVVVSLLGLSPFGCASQTLEGTDRNISQVSSPGNATNSAQGPQVLPVPSANLTSAAKPALGNDEGNLAGPLTLETLESLAQQNNPTLVQARTQIEGERAKALQAGLYPNPVIGYVAEQVGVNSTAGELHGGFVQQETVTAGKLRLSQEKYLARASAAEIQALAQKYRVINEVRIRYYRTFGAQERLRLQRELLKTAEDTLITVQEMINVGQANQADLHQARVLFQDQQLNVNMMENDLEMEWEWLMAVVGVPRPLETFPGSLEGKTVPIQWEPELRRILAKSPELALARALLKAEEITVEREKVQFIPNFVLQGSAGPNFETGDNVYGVGVFFQLPIFDRNQGTIQQAQADLRRQQAEVRLTELRLRRSLAEQVKRHRTALQHLNNYRNVILPESQERYKIRLKSYEKNRETWPAVLEAQQDYFLRRRVYIDHLVAWRSATIAIDGLLLVDGLTPPPSVTLPGHIDAVPKPR